MGYTPGTEACGVICAIGTGVEGLRLGTKVMVGLPEGCMQSRLENVPAAACTVLPEGLSFAEGAAFLVAYTTAYHCLVERACCGTEDAVLINGATGGVGLAAVQIAKAIGCRIIIATGSGAAKLEVASRLGATHCFDLAAPALPLTSLAAKMKEWTSGHGVNVVYDPVGGKVFEESLRGTAWGARVLIVGFASGIRPVLRANYALIKGLTVMGCRAGESVRKNPLLREPRMVQLLKWVHDGRLRPHISHKFHVTHVRKAFAAVLDRKVTGKAIVTFPTGALRADPVSASLSSAAVAHREHIAVACSAMRAGWSRL